jgi:hypothetical protein
MIHVHPLSEYKAVEFAVYTPHQTLKEMHRSSFDFLLTGSRSSSRHTGLSDYDFAAQEKTIFFLKGIGFKNDAFENRDNSYRDRNTLTVYEYANVDVCIVKNMRLRFLLEEYILKNNIVVPKGDFNFVNGLYDIVEGITTATKEKDEVLDILLDLTF